MPFLTTRGLCFRQNESDAGGSAGGGEDDEAAGRVGERLVHEACRGFVLVYLYE